MKRTFTRAIGVVGLLALLSLSAGAFRLGIGAGYDPLPPGLLVYGALTETTIGEVLMVRAQVGMAGGGTAGLLLLGASLLLHTDAYPPFDPYVGLGGGVAATPAGYADAITAEAVLGSRVTVSGPIGVFAQARFIVRFADPITAGPLFEAGIHLLF